MDTDKLIGELAHDLKPVSVLPSPLRRTVTFSLSALLLVGVFIVVAGMREDAAAVSSTPRFLFEIFAMGVAGVLSAFAAFHLSVPDTKIRKPVLVTLLLATAAWIMLGLVCCGDLSDVHDHHTMGLHCIRDLAALVVAPVIAAFFLLNRGAPIWQGWAGFGMLLSVASFCGIGMRFLCANDTPAHLLIWHYLPVFVLALGGIALGKLLIRAKKR